MKNNFILITCIFFLAACTSKGISSAETVKQYYTAFDAADFARMLPLVSDSLTIAEGDYATTYSHDSFYEQFKWDSIFQPSYELIDIAEEEGSIIATVASSSVRYEFLKNNPLTCRFSITFSGAKISRIDVLDCPDADWGVWEAERELLVSWVSENHPELDGFIHDLSMQGAINYMKAIELYENRTGEMRKP